MRLAHLSDLHLLEATPTPRLRLRYLSFFRPLDAAARRAHALTGLTAARAGGADHLVVTGDLTEEGTAAQFQVVADLLAESGWAGDRVTLLPGNHDRYAEPTAWADALDGPLAPWAGTSRTGTLVERDGAVIVPLDSSIPQSWVSSAGNVSMDDVPAHDTLRDAARGRAVVLAVHHPPFRVRTHAVHGMRNHAALRARLCACEGVQVLHGHIHRRADRELGVGGPRVYSAQAITVDANALRLYDVADGRLVPHDEQALDA